MVDTLRLPQSNTMILDINGDPVSGAKLEVFDAGTTNQKNVFTDATLVTAADNPIVANGSGVIPVRYLGTGDYKVTFKDASDVTLSHYGTEDDAPGARDTSSFLTGTVSPSRSVISKTTNYTTVAGDLGKQINADATGGSFTITLLSAVTAGDGGDFVVKHSGTANEVTTSATQNIDQKNSHILQSGDSATYRSDGADYHIAEAYSFTSGIVTITYAAAITPDFSFPDGTDYLVTLTGALTVNAPTNLRVGQKGTFTLIQDGTGSHATTWNSAFNETGSLTLNTDADAINKVNFHVRETGEIDLWIGNQVVQTDNRILLETVTATSGTTANNASSLDQTYRDLEIDFKDISSSGAYQLLFKLSDDNNSTFLTMSGIIQGSDGGAATNNATTSVSTGISMHLANDNASGLTSGRIRIQNYAEASTVKTFDGVVTNAGGAVSPGGIFSGATDAAVAAINGIQFEVNAGAFDGAGGEIKIYGVPA